MKKSCQFLFRSSTLVIILMIGVATTNAQSSNPMIDSLSRLVNNDQDDTIKILHMADLAYEWSFENIDTAIFIDKQAADLALAIINGEKAKKDFGFMKKTKSLLGLIYSDLGVSYWTQDDYETALGYHLKSLQLRNEINEKGGMASSYGNIGVVYYSQGDYPKALEFDFKSLFIHKEMGLDDAVAHDLNNIGLIYKEMNDLPKALECYEKAYAINKKLKNIRGTYFQLSNIGGVYEVMKQFEKARINYEEALKLATEAQDQRSIAAILDNLGNTYLGLSEKDKALELYTASLKLHQELGELSAVSACMVNIGSLKMELKNYEEAEKYFLKALNISYSLQAKNLIKVQCHHLSELYAVTNRFELAFKYHKRFTNVKDSLFNEDKSKEVGKLEARHEMEIAEMEKARKAEEERLAAISKRNRKNLIQYSGIALVLFILGIIMTLMGVIKVKPAVASGIIFLGLLLLFEFLLVLFDPFIDRISNGEPAYKLMLNAVIALGIFPLHSLSERSLKRRLVKK